MGILVLKNLKNMEPGRDAFFSKRERWATNIWYLTLATLIGGLVALETLEIYYHLNAMQDESASNEDQYAITSIHEARASIVLVLFSMASVTLYLLFRELGIVYGKMVGEQQVKDLKKKGFIFITGYVINGLTDILA